MALFAQCNHWKTSPPLDPWNHRPSSSGDPYCYGSQAPWYKADTLPAKCELVRRKWSFTAEWRCAREAEMKAIHFGNPN
jgi:hypothetical protein